MKKIIIALLLIISVAVAANNDKFRTLIATQFRAIVEPLLEKGEATQPQFDAFYAEMVENLPTELRAEKALELAINRFVGATDYIIAHAQDWRGHVVRNPKLSALITTAINAPLIEIRMAGFEIYLAQYDLDKSEEQIDILLQRFENNPEGNGPWALWSMAVIGARGISRERIFDELLFATEIENTTIRRWAVDSLAKFGGEEVVMPLLQIAAYDSSPIVQERAFCGLAQSGTLHVIERYNALEGLLVIIRDDESTQQTRDWAFQALKEISNFYDIPDNADKWEKRLIEVDMILTQMQI